MNPCNRTEQGYLNIVNGNQTFFTITTLFISANYRSTVMSERDSAHYLDNLLVHHGQCLGILVAQMYKYSITTCRAMAICYTCNQDICSYRVRFYKCLKVNNLAHVTTCFYLTDKRAALCSLSITLSLQRLRHESQPDQMPL